MRATTRRTQSMVKRVLAFEASRPSSDASHISVVTKLQEQYTRFAQLVEADNIGRQEERSATTRRKRLRGAIAAQVRHLLRVAEMGEESDPDLATHFVGTASNAPNRVFYGAARTLQGRVTSQLDRLLALGLGDTFPAELAENLDAFEAASAATDDGRLEHIAAGGELRTVAGRCRAIVEVLDGLNRARFPRESSEIVAWESSRNIFGPVSRSETTAAAPPDAEKASVELEAPVTPGEAASKDDEAVA